MTKLYIFDADGTLCDRETGNLLPNVIDTIKSLPSGSKIAIATNQGGVGLRYWMEKQGFGEPENYPTEGEVRAQYDKVGQSIGAIYVAYAFRYQSKSSGKWGPRPQYRPANMVPGEWLKSHRKPEIGMINEIYQACEFYSVQYDTVIFVGDSAEDKEAAHKAGIRFIHADKFFERV